MSGKLFTDDAMSSYLLRQWMRHDVERAATCILWGLYSPAEALEEVKGQGRLCAARAGNLKCSSDAVVRGMLVDEYRRQTNIHARTHETIKIAVLAVLRANGDRALAARAAGSVANDQALPPPPHIVVVAIEDAAKEHRMANAWWRKRVIA